LESLGKNTLNITRGKTGKRNIPASWITVAENSTIPENSVTSETSITSTSENSIKSENSTTSENSTILEISTPKLENCTQMEHPVEKSEISVKHENLQEIEGKSKDLEKINPTPKSGNLHFKISGKNPKNLEFVGVFQPQKCSTYLGTSSLQ